MERMEIDNAVDENNVLHSSFSEDPSHLALEVTVGRLYPWCDIQNLRLSILKNCT